MPDCKCLQNCLIPLAIAAVCSGISASALASPLATPDALGFGANATGGRGGTVQVVTNLNDSGAGSFRQAVSQANSIVVFDVGGVINLQSELAIAGNVTIFGQTAPGQGIAIEGGSNGYNLSLSNSSNDIVQYLRVLQGGPSNVQKTAVDMYGTTNALLDHVSIEYGPYDNIDAVGNGNTGGNITIGDGLTLNNGSDEFTVGSGQTLTLNGPLNRNNATVDFADSGTINGNSLANTGTTGIIGGWATFNQTDWATVTNNHLGRGNQWKPAFVFAREFK